MKELKKYLTINIIFSAFSSLTMLLFSSNLNKLFNSNNVYVFPIIGSNLLIFAVFVWYVSIRPLINKNWVVTITALDALWVLGSFAIVSFGLFDLSNDGYIIVSSVAVWIAFLAYKQFKFNGHRPIQK